MTTYQSDLPYITLEDELLAPLSGHELTEAGLFTAGLILTASTERPVTIAQIAMAHLSQRGENVSDRMVKDMIRTFRRVHGFPICSRKGKPAGYWWGRSEAEIAEFVRTWQSQYLDETTTLHRMLTVNYPRLAGQMKLALEE